MPKGRKSPSPIRAEEITGTVSFNSTLKDIRDWLVEKAKNTGLPARLYIEAGQDGSFQFIFTQDRERIENIVRETDSERRERQQKERREKTKRKVFFWGQMIRAFFDGLGNLWKKVSS